MSSKLFQPLKVGTVELKHRMVMAPLTRFRADDDHSPNDLMAEYYAQRASTPGTLIISEATLISPRASGYPNVPGLWSDAQIAGWKKVTDAVHAKGSFIYAQLWALGRAANPDQLRKEFDGEYAFASASAVPMQPDGPVPTELTEDEIHAFIADYARAAKRAVFDAGFDGVEIHAANGYLIDQFTQDTCNRRADGWGGSVEKRARFGLEVARAVVAAVGRDRTGIRLSPWSTFQGMRMADPIPQFTHLIQALRALRLAYLHLVESRIAGNTDIEASDRLDFALDAWGASAGPVLLAGGFTPDSARALVDEQHPDRDLAVVFGRAFISTPDLPFRIQHGIPLAPYNRDTFYAVKSPGGYTDYPFSQEFLAAQKSGKL